MAFVRTRRRRGGRYYFVVGRDGRERSAGKDRGLAKRWAARLDRAEMRVRAGEEAFSTSTWTLTDLARFDLEDAKTSGKETASRRRRWLVLLVGFGPETLLDRITAPQIERFTAARLKAGASTRTVNRDRSLLSAGLALARRRSAESCYSGDPFRVVHPIKETSVRKARALTQEQAKRLITAAWMVAARAPVHLRREWKDNATIIETIYLTGSRASQIFGLQNDQLAGGIVKFPAHKGGRPRQFFLEGRLKKILKPGAGRWTFEGRGRAGHREGLRRFWLATLKEAKLPGYTLHDLRHTHATLALYGGESVPQVAARLGHRDTTMVTRLYGHVFPETMRPLRATTKTTVRSRHESAGYPVQRGPSVRDRVIRDVLNSLDEGDGEDLNWVFVNRRASVRS